MTGDEVWLAVKFQTNLEIAGSPRNSFRTSVGYEFNGGKALNGLGGFTAYRTLSNSECRINVSWESDCVR